jgi:hypothetical protein
LTTVEPCVPPTSPDRGPEKLTAVVAVVAVVAEVAVEAFPFKAADIIPAEKFPEASLFTMALAVFKSVEALDSNSAECMLAAEEVPTVFTVTDPVSAKEASPLTETAAAKALEFPTQIWVSGRAGN